MARRDPKVSIVIPAYNSADYTVLTVESALAQTYAHTEVIVIDDGSTDGTREAMLPFADRVRYIYKENGGACSARNLGIESSDGEYVACLDCDDLWLPEKLEYSIAILEADVDLALVFTSCLIIDERGEEVGRSNYRFDLDNAYMELLNDNYIMAPTVVMRRSSLLEVGKFDEEIFIPADWDLWLRLARRFRIGCVDKALSKYRKASNYTLRNIPQFVGESHYVIEKQFAHNSELSAGDRRRIMGQLHLLHSGLYRDSGDMPKVRQCLRKAIQSDPYDWRPYAHYLISHLGARNCEGLVQVKRERGW